ncbi:MAG: hypothetical protein LVS60_04040 [Nodosilinea sp. LVE1205-7]|jgi:hypothetical protein
MAFPVPGDAIEPSLALNRHLIPNPTATFLMREEISIVFLKAELTIIYNEPMGYRVKSYGYNSTRSSH